MKLYGERIPATHRYNLRHKPPPSWPHPSPPNPSCARTAPCAGWKFWIPAASINFYCVPLKYQVLYMSACGILWTAYLSMASNTAGPAPAAKEVAAAATAAGEKPCCAGKGKSK